MQRGKSASGIRPVGNSIQPGKALDEDMVKWHLDNKIHIYSPRHKHSERGSPQEVQWQKIEAAWQGPKQERIRCSTGRKRTKIGIN